MVHESSRIVRLDGGGAEAPACMNSRNFGQVVPRRRRNGPGTSDGRKFEVEEGMRSRRRRRWWREGSDGIGFGVGATMVAPPVGMEL